MRYDASRSTTHICLRAPEMTGQVARRAASWDTILNSMVLLKHHAACQPPGFSAAHRPVTGARRRSSRSIKGLQAQVTADPALRDDAGSMVKRKVAMHVAYCGTGYQGGPHPHHTGSCFGAAAVHAMKQVCMLGTMLHTMQGFKCRRASQRQLQ